MIYVGTQYFRAPTPAPEYWERDIKQAKAYGLDYFRFWIIWNWYSQKENFYDFTSLEKLLDLCIKYDMKAIMLTNLESVPAWLTKKHPEAVYRDAKGGMHMPESASNTPAGGFPGLCFHNAPIIEYGKDFLYNLSKTFKGHPAIECWEPHNEPMFEAGRYNDHIYCYCDASVEAFREYLKDKYNNIEILNVNWRRNYGEFDEVQPPRRRGMYNDWLDWRQFNLDSLISTLQWRIDTIRENDPNHYVMIHTRGGSGVTRNLAKEGIDDYRMASLVDKYGTAAFPQCGPEHEYFIAMTGARCASRGKEFWMAELQSGPYGMGIHRNDAEPRCEYCGSSTMEATIDQKEGVFDPGEVTPERLKMWSWSGIAQGAKGILYWQYRNESFGLEYGFGLTNLDGSPHARLETVREFRRVIRENEDLIDNATLPANKIAIAWDPKNDIINWTAVGCTDAVKNSIKGIHKALWHADYPIDILRLDTDVVDDDFTDYDILYLPFSPYVSTTSVVKLKTFVEQGGTLIAEASIAQFDDTMGVNPRVPGNGLDELFGCRRTDIRTMHQSLIPSLKIDNLTIGTRMHKEILTPLGNAVCIGTFSTGEPAVIENRLGKGRAIYIGSNPFMAYATKPDPNLVTWINHLHKDIERQSYTDTPDVIARTLISKNRKLVFLLNTTSESVTTHLHSMHDPKTTDIREIIEGKPVNTEYDNGRSIIKEHLEPYGVKVYII